MTRMMLCILLVIVLLLEQPQLTKGRGVIERPLSPSLDYAYTLNEASNVNSSIPVYDIIYNLNLGENHYLNPSVYYEQLLPLKLMPPQREGYNFAGWYTDSSYKHPLTEIEDCKDGNLILYAKWTKKISGSMNIQLYSYGASSLTRSPEKKLADMNYRILEDLDIPGMPNTRFEDYIKNKLFSVDQCPQGLCVTEELILVTSYSTGRSDNYGCLYVFDRDTGDYLMTLSMKQGSHLGGICYDGESLWVCHSNYRTIERLDYALIKELAKHSPGRTI